MRLFPAPVLLLCAVLCSPSAAKSQSVPRNAPTDSGQRPFAHYTSHSNVETFGTAIKGLQLRPGQEALLFNYTRPEIGSSDANLPACVTAMWFTGQLLWPTFGEVVARVYIDGEAKPSLEYPIQLAIGISSAEAPWGIENIGKLAIDGGVYSTVRIPFHSSIRVTAQLSDQDTESKTLYFMLRGLNNYNVVLPGSQLSLPSNARLRLHKTNTTLQPLEWVALANVSNAGAIYLVVQQLHSGNAHALEGIHMIWDLQGREIMQASSGFEDYYLSAQYFDAGKFRTPLAGLTAEDHWLEPNRLTAYRLHHLDPLVFQRPFSFGWRNGMHDSGSLAAKESHHVSFVWTYEW